jgi:hypothetical protein
MTYTLPIPDDVYQRARQIAEETSQPIDRVMIDYLRTLSAPLPVLPPDEEAELDAMKHLSDDTLWTIAREQMAAALQEQMQSLMDGNSRGTLTTEERNTLENLVERGQRLMLRKSEAAALLTQRGYRVTPEDMAGHG